MRLAAERVGMSGLRLQAELYDAQGHWIGRFDAFDEATGSLFEYDGEQHLYLSRQRRRDPKRLQHARDAGYRVMLLFREDILAGLLPAGRSMLEFNGGSGKAIRRTRASLLDEWSGDATEAAISRQRFEDGRAGS